MKILAWNGRGLVQPRARQELCCFVRKHKLGVVWLTKTKADAFLMKQLQSSLQVFGIRGGFCYFWSNLIYFSIIKVGITYVIVELSILHILMKKLCTILFISHHN